MAPKATPRLVRSTARRGSPETWSTSGRITSKAARISRPTCSDGRVAGNNGIDHLAVQLQSAADHRLGIIGVILQRGPGKQPAHQLTALDPEAQRHIRVIPSSRAIR